MMKWQDLLNSTRLRSSPSMSPETSLDTNTNTDARTEFERDYGRVIFCTPVRRLQDKTQVFPLDPNDSIRTRLTHSLEVSSLARGVADRVATRLLEEGHIDLSQARDIQTIAATCGLLHDIGNPPFGHAGEWAIQEWFKKMFEGKELTSPDFEMDLLKFDGNPQTMRLIMSLQILMDDSGLNLTAGTLSAALKYPLSSAQAGSKDKIGYFCSERERVDRVRALACTGNFRNPITFLVEIADDAVNSSVDLEDGVRKKVVRWSDIESHLRSVQVGDVNWMHRFNEGMRAKYGEKSWDDSSDRVKVELFRTKAIGTIVEASVAEFHANYSQIMRGEFDGEIAVRSAAGQLVKECKKFSKDRIFSTNTEILSLEIMARKVIHDLMDIFWGAWSKDEKVPSTKYGRKIYNVLSSNYRDVYQARIEKSGLTNSELLYARAQLIADYVCGMTDSFACSLHRKLLNG